MSSENDVLQKQFELQKQIEILESIAKQYLSKESITRYYTLKSAHPEKALHVITIIAKLAESNQIQEKLTDEQFKQLLLNMEKPKREFKIRKF